MKQVKALVIDDEKIVLDSVEKILAAENYAVEVSLSGISGIRLAVEKPFDVVLTDIRMPDIGGLIVLRDIKREKPELPVIIITGYGTVRSAIQAMKLGAADYIEKPFSPDQLIAAVSGVMAAKDARFPESQKIVNPDEMRRVLSLAATDEVFRRDLMRNGADALDDYQLTGPEKLALITGDVGWIEAQMGSLPEEQKKWLEARLSAEVW
jgi:DNA-binding NtrC family response regulator